MKSKKHLANGVRLAVNLAASAANQTFNAHFIISCFIFFFMFGFFILLQQLYNSMIKIILLCTRTANVKHVYENNKILY